MPVIIAACLVVAAISLVTPSTPTYDPWAWIMWGREIAHLDLVTDEAKINVFRIVQEALTNIAKHARATEVEVSLRRTVRDIDGLRDVLDIAIADNGIGFETQRITPGLGLLGMRERSRMKAPSVPVMNGAGRKYGRVVSTP